MQEAFLQFLWRYQKFSTPQLTTANGDSLRVLQPGVWNEAEGPDFKNAKIRLGEVMWTGHVEVHLKSSDWWHHQHHRDPNYDAVILHVVWDHDRLIFSPSGTPIPTLILSEFVARRWMDNYRQRFSATHPWIPCAASLQYFPEEKWGGWKDRLLIERLNAKTDWIYSQLSNTQNDWEAVLFRQLAQSFGLHANGAAFAEIARQIPMAVLRKLHHPQALEALFLGSAGLLPSDTEEGYALELKTLYRYLQRKFRLSVTAPPSFQFARLRPANFPTVRWALLAALYDRHPRPFRELIDAQRPDDIRWLTSLQASAYWDTHYTFGARSRQQKKKISTAFFELLLINCMIPIRFAYAKTQLHFDPEAYLDWFYQLKPEKNRIVERYQQMGVAVRSAAGSQALLQLYRKYCQPKKCLSCAVGFYLMHE